MWAGLQHLSMVIQKWEQSWIGIIIIIVTNISLIHSPMNHVLIQWIFIKIPICANQILGAEEAAVKKADKMPALIESHRDRQINKMWMGEIEELCDVTRLSM
jgi:hypothetical protein